MNRSKTCPKCRSKRIVVVPSRTQAPTIGSSVRLGSTIFSAIRLSRRICAECGYVEDWVESAKDLARITAKFGVADER
jgi:predicted nucleic-acid-binding Zn-ribbon protein